MNRLRIFLLGIAATLAFTAAWHGLGAGDRMAARAEVILNCGSKMLNVRSVP